MKKNRVLILEIELDEQFNEVSIEALEKSRKLEERNLALKKEIRELKTKIVEM